MSVSAAPRDSPDPLDLLLAGGTVVDGTGRARFAADVGIAGDRIAAIGDLSARPARRRLDLAGLAVCPGFVDPLHNFDLGPFTDPSAPMAVTQGVTTALGGCCGVSMAPVSAPWREAVRVHAMFKTGWHDQPFTWTGFGDYLAAIAGRAAVNYLSLVGFDNLWFAVRGFDPSPPSARDLDAMADLAGQALAEGAVGLSHGAGAASLWSRHEDVVHVARAVGRGGGFYACHQRALESDDPFAAFREGIAVGREAGLPVHFLHFKSISPRTHGREAEMLQVVDAARDEGLDVTFASYPYGSGGGGFRAPAWAEAGGPDQTLMRLADPVTRSRIAADLEAMWRPWLDGTYVTYVHTDGARWMVGQPLARVAEGLGTSVGEAACRILVEQRLAAQHMHRHGGDEGLAEIARHPAHMSCSDAIYAGCPHPRCFGAYPRWLGRFVRDRGALSLEEFVRQSTSAPARRLGLGDRGVLEPGWAADLVVFDPATVADRATDEDPGATAVGIRHVIVNGQPVLGDGEPVPGARPGHVLRRAA